MRLSIALSLLMSSAAAFAPSAGKERLSALSYSNYPFNTYSLADAERAVASQENNRLKVDDREPPRDYVPSSSAALQERRSNRSGVSTIGIDSYINSNRTFRPSSWRHGAPKKPRSLFDEMNQVSSMNQMESPIEPVELEKFQSAAAPTIETTPEPIEANASTPTIAKSSPVEKEEAITAVAEAKPASPEPKASAPVVQEKKVELKKPTAPEKPVATTKPTTSNELVSISNVPMRTLTPLEKKYASQQVVSKLDTLKPKVEALSSPNVAEKPAMPAADTRTGKHFPFRTLTPLEQKYADQPKQSAKKPRVRVVAPMKPKTYPSRTLTPLEKRYATAETA